MTQSDEMVAPAPEINPETDRFWTATSRGELLIGTCANCGDVHYPPRSYCPTCFSDATEHIEASGRGTIYSHTIIHTAKGEYEDEIPYILAYVELTEGPRMLTNVVDCSVEGLQIGQEVEVVFHETSVQAALPRFRPLR